MTSASYPFHSAQHLTCLKRGLRFILWLMLSHPEGIFVFYVFFLFCYLALLSPALNINLFLCVWKLYTCVCYCFCVSLHSQTDRLFALSRLKQSGAYLTTTEAVLLQLVQDAKHPNFKEVLTTAALCTRLLSYFVYVCFRCVINISLVVYLKEK